MSDPAKDSPSPRTAARPQGRPPSGWNLFSVRGIRISIHYSWLIIFVLIVWSLSAGYLPRTHPGQSPGSYWVAGLIGTLLFFGSVLAHELAHSIVAQFAGMKVPGITLFVFGGVSQLEETAKDPATELKIAIVGPLCSFALALLFWVLGAWIWPADASLPGAVVGYLAWINVALGVFNLVPGFPLDGGRVLRSILWWKTGSLTRATQWASDVGKGFAYTLMALGAVQIFTGALVGGLWFIFIGMFLRSVAEGEYQQTVMRKSLEGVRVRDVMIEDVVTVTPDLPIRTLIHDYFLHYGYKGFPVSDGDRIVGIVALRNVKTLSAEEQEGTTVGQVMLDLEEGDQIAPDRSLAEALKQLALRRVQRLLVMDDGRMVGILTKDGLTRFMEIKRVLEG